MNQKIVKEIELRLKARIIALERISKGQYLSKVFVGAALNELRMIQKVVERLDKKK